MDCIYSCGVDLVKFVYYVYIPVHELEDRRHKPDEQKPFNIKC